MRKNLQSCGGFFVLDSKFCKTNFNKYDEHTFYLPKDYITSTK